MKLRISARAQHDLDYIYAFIFARQGLDAADRFLQHAMEAVTFLAQNPEAGPHPRWATRHKTLRYWVISRTNFLIFYFEDERGVSVERVLDGRRDVKRIIEQRLEETSSGED
jgi:plasmid stabilization system protein ParE